MLSLARIRPWLFAILLLLVLLDLSLFLYSYSAHRDRGGNKNSFHLRSQANIPKGEIFQFVANHKNGVLSRFLATGTVSGKIILDSNNSVYIPIEFPLKYFASQRTSLYLGSINEKISIMKTKVSEKDEGQLWSPWVIKDALPYLKPGVKVTIKLPMESASQEKLNFSDCNEACKKFIKAINTYYGNNIELGQIITGHQKLRDLLKIGPALEIAILDEN